MNVSEAPAFVAGGPLRPVLERPLTKAGEIPKDFIDQESTLSKALARLLPPVRHPQLQNASPAMREPRGAESR